MISFGFLPQLKAVFWCNPCVGKVDTASFWSIPWWKCRSPATENTFVLIGEKRKQKRTQENQKFSKDRAGWSEESIGSSKVALLWRMHVPVVLLKFLWYIDYIILFSKSCWTTNQLHTWFAARFYPGPSRHECVLVCRERGPKSKLATWNKLPRPSPGFAPAFVGRIHNVLLCMPAGSSYLINVLNIYIYIYIYIYRPCGDRNTSFFANPAMGICLAAIPSASIISCIPSVNQYSDCCWCDMFISHFCCNPQFFHNPITWESPATVIRDSPRWGGGSKSVHEEKAEEAHEAIAAPQWEFASCQGRPFVTFKMLWARFLIF